MIVVAVLLVLAGVMGNAVIATTADVGNLSPRGVSPAVVLQSAGLMFFAFAARIATLGEEVRDPARTIPRAILTALAITLTVYAGVAVAVLMLLGPRRLAATATPLVDAVQAAGSSWMAPVVGAGAVLAATVDLRGAIGFSSFAVLVYYTIANASAFTLRREEGRPHKGIPVLGVLGCALLAVALPPQSVIAGLGVLAVGALLFWLRRAWATNL